MKKLVLTIVALVAVATSSLAQYFMIYQPSSSVSYKAARETYNVPTVSSYSIPTIRPYNMPSTSSYSVPAITSYSMPSTTNFNTTNVSGYTRSNGTYVMPHVRTMPNTTNWDNFSTQGNINIYTGSTGHRAKDYSSDAYNYGAGRIIHTGSRGGHYYYNSNGRKTYVPKRNLW